VIEAIDLTVRRRGRTVLDAVSFDVRPGQVTAVLGGTGAGKTTLLRRMVQLERGGGETLFDGRPYRALRHPMREVGLLLDPGAGHPDRTVRGQLRLALATDRRAAREVVVGVRHAAGGGDGRRPPGGGDPRRSSGEGDVTRLSGDGDAQRSSGEGDLRRLSGERDVRRLSGEEDARRSLDDGLEGQADSNSGTLGNPTTASRGRRLADTIAARRRRKLTDELETSRRGRPADRIDAVLDIVGLTEQGSTRLADLTDGMATRLAIAVALLGDPQALLFDCPERGLEPEGVAWLGALLRAFTGQGRAALVTGSDTETLVGMADRILLLDSGYLVGTRTAEEVLRAPTGAAVIVRSPQIVRFAAILAEAGARSSQGEGACLEVRGMDRARVGDLAYRNGIPVHELSERFTGSDPADLVLAACSGRDRPIVPIQGLPVPESVLQKGLPASVQPSRAQFDDVRAGRAQLSGSRTPSAWPSGARSNNVQLISSPAGSALAEGLLSGSTAGAEVAVDDGVRSQPSKIGDVAEKAAAADHVGAVGGAKTVEAVDAADRASAREPGGAAGRADMTEIASTVEPANTAESMDAAEAGR
jgi:ABC-type multidrug transport system ATPase subunit